MGIVKGGGKDKAATKPADPEPEVDQTGTESEDGETEQTPESKLADFSKAKDAKAKEEKKKVRKDGLSDLPPLPRAKKAKPPQDCACGCGLKTKGGAYQPGHDGRPKGWALRVERGIVKLADIPEGERAVVAKLLKERKATASQNAKETPAEKS